MEGEDEESEEAGSFTKAPVGNRILVTVAGAVMNLLLGFVVLVCVVCSQQLISTRTVAEFYEGSSTQQWPPAGGRHHRCGKRTALLYRK